MDSRFNSMEKHIQPTQGTPLEHPVQVNRGTMPLAPQDTFYIRLLCPDWEIQQFYLIHKNKHRRQPK